MAYRTRHKVRTVVSLSFSISYTWTVFWCLNFRFPESLQPVDSKRINSKSSVRTPSTDWRKPCSLYLTTESGVLAIVYVINLLQYMHYWIQLIINLLQFISNMPQLMWSLSRTINDKIYSDMGIFNGSFVDHSWICLLDRAYGYVDKSFRKTTCTTDYEGFRAYLLTVTTDILRFLAGSRALPGHRSAASTVFSDVCLYR